MYNQDEDEDELKSELDEALDCTVMPLWGWRQLRDSEILEERIASELKEPGGGTKNVIRLAWLGKPALNTLERAMEVAEVSAAQVARDYEGEGEFSSPMAAIMAGNDVWLKWLLKNGADPQWRDFGGKTLISHLFKPNYLNDLIYGQPIGKRVLSKSTILRWAKGQERCATFLKKQDNGRLWEILMAVRDLSGRTAGDHFVDNMAKLSDANWLERLDPETSTKLRSILLKSFAQAKPSARSVKPSM